MDRPYPDGIDCVWLAVDRDGHLGAFVTGGEGPIPLQALNSAHSPVEEIEERIYDLPRVSDARLLVEMKRPDDFVAIAERGFFVYDWTDVQRTMRESVHAYELVAVPVNPITIDAVPDEIVGLVAGLGLDNATFVNGGRLDVCAYLSCREKE